MKRILCVKFLEVALCCLLILLSFPCICLASPNTFTVTVPHRGSTKAPISRVRITLEVTGNCEDATLNFVNAGRGLNKTLNLGEFWPDPDEEPDEIDEVVFEMGGTSSEIIIEMALLTNCGSDLCSHSSDAFTDEWINWEFTFSDDNDDCDITGYRLTSYCALSSVNCICPGRRIDDIPAEWLTAPSGADDKGRHALDVILVLDESGSMGGYVPADLLEDDEDPEVKMVVLKWAVEQFVELWKAEATEDIKYADDRLAVVMFTTPNVTALEFSGNFFVERGNLLASDPNHPWNDIIDAVNLRSPSNMTPLGDGIRMAIDNWNADKKNDLSIVLMTNGMQNAGHQVVPDTIHPDLLALYDTEDGVNVPLRDKCILIQTIGVGAPGDVPSDLLNKIAEQTGGISDLTAVSTMDFSFQSALVESLKGNTMDLVSRVRSTLNRNVMDRTHEVTFNPSVKRAIFVLGWRSWADALELEVSKPPGRTSITPALKLENDNPDKLFYTVQAVNIPAEGPPGLWSVKVKRKGTNTSPIVYHLSIYVVEEKFAYRLGFNKADFGTGDDIILRAELSEKGLPLKNQDGALKVEVSRPLTALGSFLKAREVAVSQSPGGDDPESPYMRKLRNLLENTKLRRLIEPVKDTVTYTLYDSGNLSEHGDKKADDGIYSMKYTNTKVPGQYKFKVTLNTTTPVSGKISRVEERETMVMVKTADPDESEIYQEKLPGEKRLITIIPADQFGNFLGPGYEENISITSSVGNAPPIEDKRVNGTYTTIFSNVPSDVDPIYTIKLYGKEFFTGPISPPPERVIIGAYWGRNIPYNSLNIAYNSGWSLEGILEYLFSPRASIFASVGWNKFNPDLPGLEELKVINFSGNLKLYPVIGTFQLSIFGGGGYYLFDEPFEDRFGLNLGSAAELRISTSFSIEAKYNYNYVFTSGDKTKFATIQGGLRLRL